MRARVRDKARAGLRSSWGVFTPCSSAAMYLARVNGEGTLGEGTLGEGRGRGE